MARTHRKGASRLPWTSTEGVQHPSPYWDRKHIRHTSDTSCCQGTSVEGAMFPFHLSSSRRQSPVPGSHPGFFLPSPVKTSCDREAKSLSNRHVEFLPEHHFSELTCPWSLLCSIVHTHPTPWHLDSTGSYATGQVSELHVLSLQI